MNSVALMGRLTKDVEVRQAGETQVANFCIAVDDGYGDRKHTSFFNLVAFGKTAENIAKYFQKGSRIAVDGKLRQERWEKDGKNYSDVKVIVNQFDFVDKKAEEKTDTDGFMSIPEEMQEELPFV